MGDDTTGNRPPFPRSGLVEIPPTCARIGTLPNNLKPNLRFVRKLQKTSPKYIVCNNECG